MKKYIFLLVVLLLTGANAFAQETDEKREAPVLVNEEYGPHERNRFDIALPPSEQATPLVIFIHGGGFRAGDKSDGFRRENDVKFFLRNNIAFASINYRFYQKDDSLGVNACLEDVVSALQYIRHNAEKYNIDKARIGVYGVSAGAGSSLYLALHDDFAVPGAEGPEGESTRVQCAAALATQATYDVFRWRSILPGMRLALLLNRKAIYNSAANFYGYPDYESFKPVRKEVTKNLDMLDMVDPEDPPVYLMNLTPGYWPKNDNIMQHHRKHAIAVARKLKRNKVEHFLFVADKSTKSEKDVEYPVAQFFVDHLNTKQ